MAGLPPLDDGASSALPGEKIEEAREQNIEPREDKKARESDASDVGGEGLEDVKPGLPLPKARCIALVATLTGASFLNVCRRRFAGE